MGDMMGDIVGILIIGVMVMANMSIALWKSVGENPSKSITPALACLHCDNESHYHAAYVFNT